MVLSTFLPPSEDCTVAGWGSVVAQVPSVHSVSKQSYQPTHYAGPSQPATLFFTPKDIMASTACLQTQI